MKELDPSSSEPAAKHFLEGEVSAVSAKMARDSPLYQKIKKVETNLSFTSNGFSGVTQKVLTKKTKGNLSNRRRKCPGSMRLSLSLFCWDVSGSESSNLVHTFARFLLMTFPFGLVLGRNE